MFISYLIVTFKYHVEFKSFPYLMFVRLNIISYLVSSFYYYYYYYYFYSCFNLFYWARGPNPRPIFDGFILGPTLPNSRPFLKPKSKPRPRPTRPIHQASQLGQPSDKARTGPEVAKALGLLGLPQRQGSALAISFLQAS